MSSLLPTRQLGELPVVAIAASLGGLAALSKVLGALPAELPAAVLVVQHLQSGRESGLAAILGRRTGLSVKEARPGDRLRAGHVFIAPPGYHLLLGRRGFLGLSHGYPVHYSRPAADVLLRSVASRTGKLAMAAILTGSGRDGTAGSLAIRHGGGFVIAQDRATSFHFGMPGAVALAGGADLILPLDAIAGALLDQLQILGRS